MHWFCRNKRGLLTVRIWQYSKLVFNGRILDYVKLQKNLDPPSQKWKRTNKAICISRRTLMISNLSTLAKKRNIIVNYALFQYRLKISNQLFPNSQLFDKFNYLKYLTNYFFPVDIFSNI